MAAKRTEANCRSFPQKGHIQNVAMGQNAFCWKQALSHTVPDLLPSLVAQTIHMGWVQMQIFTVEVATLYRGIVRYTSH